MASKKITRRIKPRVVKVSDSELCARFRKGDFPAFTELSKIYSRLIDTVADKYANQRLPKQELVLFAKIGLLKAAHRYDESKMVSFRLYAIWWMRQSITKGMQEQAYIEQVPELLINNLHEIMESFKHNGIVLIPDTEYIDIANTVEDEISEMEKLKVIRGRRKAS